MSYSNSRNDYDPADYEDDNWVDPTINWEREGEAIQAEHHTNEDGDVIWHTSPVCDCQKANSPTTNAEDNQGYDPTDNNEMWANAW